MFESIANDELKKTYRKNNCYELLFLKNRKIKLIVFQKNFNSIFKFDNTNEAFSNLFVRVVILEIVLNIILILY